ncbi:acetyl-CoA hydrolase/transferase family protein [Panacagrimonas sp.]|uniref:acetyl-CoA hydrolase/transferase family protein n=1 Tax=Panacagrimonas sp. TaxID=2480088 RepID=UPI003B51CDFC
MNTPDLSSVEAVVAALKPGMSVFVPGMSGESLAFAEALRARPEAAAGVRFVGVHFPGINTTDYLGLHPEARQRAYFMTPRLRPGLADGRAEFLPLDYPGIFRDLSEHVTVDLAIAQVSPPDAAGICGLGASCDFHPAIWARARRRIAHINPSLPRTRSAFVVRGSDFDAAFEAPQPLLTYDAGVPDTAMLKHGARVAALVQDGDTLEFGVGKLQAAILASLRSHRRLRVWSGMVSPPVLGLLDSGAIRGRGSVQAGVALGDAAFYERVGRDPAFLLRPVNETHDVRRIARIRSFCAINSAVEVDLFGQVNADSIGSKLVAGVGGLPSFVAGASLSRGGRSIIALPATTEDARRSRIVPKLGAGFTALPRHTADHVVTEHGVASLRGLTLHARARALIDIAAPAFRQTLAQQWDEIARAL